MMAGMGVPAFPPAAPAPGPVGAAAAEPGADAGDGKVEVAFRMIAPNARTGKLMSRLVLTRVPARAISQPSPVSCSPIPGASLVRTHAN